MPKRNLFSSLYRLNLEPGEGGILFLLALCQFLLVGGTAIIGRTAGRALFLSGLPSQYIPFRYMAIPIGLVLVSVFYSRISGRFRRDHLIQMTTAGMLGGLLIFRLLLSTYLGTNLLMLGSLFVFLEIVQTLTGLQFWTFAAEVINTRQAKRLFPPVNFAGNFGGMLAGASITILVPWVGTSNLLIVLSVALVVYILLIRTLGRRHFSQHNWQKKPVSVSKKPDQGFRQSWRFLRTSPLLAAMTVIALLIALSVNIIDYQFDLTLKSTFATNPQDLSSFLGSYYFWASIAALFVQLFLSGTLLRRFGIGVTLLVLPLSMLTGSMIVLLAGASLWAVTLLRSSDAIFRYTLHDTSFNFLYVPIEQQLRSQARAVLDGVLKPIIIGLAGLLFFVINGIFGISVLPWTIAAILVVALLLVALLRLRPVYLKSLQDSIHRRYFDPAGEPLDLSDVNTVAMIRNALRHPGEAQLLHAMALAEEISNVNWNQDLLPLIDHSSSLVRRQAIRMLRRVGNEENARIVRCRFDDPDTGVQASAVFTYWALCGENALEEIQPLMHHAQPEVQAAAISGALLYGGEETRRIAHSLFMAMVASPQPLVRISAAYALGNLPPVYASEWLCILLEDIDPQVRLQAVRSAGKLNNREYIPAILAQLGDPIAGAAAGESIIHHGQQVFEYLDAIYSNIAPDIKVRRQIPGLVARIPGDQSVSFLMEHIDEPDDLARARIYIALGRLCKAGRKFSETDISVITNHFKDEIRLAYHWAVQAAGLQLASGGGLLEEALASQQRYAIDRLLYLIAILYSQANIAQVRANLFGNDPRLRANAIELLDTVLSRPHKDLILPLLEGSIGRMLEVAAREYNLTPPELHSSFAAAVEGSDSWLSACGLFSLASTKLTRLSALVYYGLQSPDALVRETALLAASQLLPPEQYKMALQETAIQDPVLYIQEYARNGLRLHLGIQERGCTMPITTIERILLLRGVELFKEIPGQDLELIARLCSEVHFAPGERLITQGDVSDGLYILLEGKVEVGTADLGVVDLRKEGDVIGEIGVLANNLRTASCTALVETTALHIDQTDFWDLLERNSSLSVGVIRVLVPKLLNYPVRRSAVEN